MKIGVLFTVYNCENYLRDCLDPWFNLKDRYDIVFAANSGMFSDYYKLNIPFRNKETLDILSEYDIDFLITTKGKNLLGEDESRNLCIDFLNKQNCDLIWVMDGDECYTKEQIINIIEFIQKNPDYDWYSVNFKNLTIRENLFLDYTHERITWANKHGGIGHFYFDNCFVYKDGSSYLSKRGLEIPKSIAYIKHNSWLSNDTRTKDKIIYQRWRYCGSNGDIPVNQRCSYNWNTEKDELEFSKEFYEGRVLEIPCLHEELSVFTHDLTINFSRFENCLKITKVQRLMNLKFEIFNGEYEHIFSTDMSLNPGVNYFIAPSSNNFDKNNNFYCFIVKVYENSQLIHEEKIHLKLK